MNDSVEVKGNVDATFKEQVGRFSVGMCLR
ncbi:hypothetical protein A2U01_0116732, partial [Trifolium medium]|nr:hypothetical protein [Trifolium medium]